MTPKPAPMTPLSERLRQWASEGGAEPHHDCRLCASMPDEYGFHTVCPREQVALVLNRLDALAALRPDLVQVLRAFEFEDDCGEPECGDCKARRTLTALLALLPEEGQ